MVARTKEDDLIRLQNINITFDQKPVLQNFIASFLCDQSYLLTGPSGAGKTTLLRLIAGLEQPDAGEIHIQPGLKIRMVFQEDRLLPHLTVLQNVMLEKGEAGRALALLKSLELDAEAAALPETLSGGMQRRVAVARALLSVPDVLLLDEPFNGLDEELRRKTASLIFREMQGKCVILATHYPEEISAYVSARIELD